MARLAANPESGARATLSLLLEPTRDRIELAFRLALICMLTALVAQYYGTPDPALTAYIVFFLNRPERTTSLIFNLAFAVLVSIVIGLVLLLAMLVVDAPAWRVVAMATVSIVFLFLASASKLRPIGAILAMIVAYALDLLGFVPSGELATRALLYAWLFVGIPAGVSLVVNLFIAPAPLRLAECGIADRLRAAAAMLRDPDEAQLRRFEHYRDEGAGEILDRLRLAHVERTVAPATAPRLTAAAYSTAILMQQVDAIRAEAGVGMAWRDEAADTIEAMAGAFDKGGYPIGIEPPAGGDALPPDARALVQDFDAVLLHFADPPPEMQVAETIPPAAAKAGFFQSDAFTNPEHLRYAVKTTAAAMFCYFLYVLLDWPGIHTCLITCYIVALGTAGETVEKLSLRILGCLVGGAIGTAALIWLIPVLDSIWGLLVVVFAGALCGGWIAAGSPRIAYAGFQFAFAFFLCVIQGAGPAFDLTIARDRVIGILIGNLVVYLVFTRVWPVSVAQRIDQSFTALLAALAAFARLPLDARRRGAPALHARFSALRGDLALIPYEPASVRPAAGWMARRDEALDAVAALAQPLLLDGDARFWTPAAAQLERLARRPGEQPDSPSAQSTPCPLTRPIHETEVPGLLGGDAFSVM
ncbi:MAG: fusaric acid resistance protein [Sphingomonas sanxanigenens]|uniref:Fusaric acid resistance protein n=1 Tax=Sphingomonas sanxanigenens TaxID=397260 RepID=A0A2W5A0V4_9SPHN|nr:MAG: fusaric acid resistance protein [Sphingomonas sanxanigenens]